MKSIIEIIPETDDDPGFIELINKIVTSHIIAWQTKEIYFIKIRDWFDHKWCYFSGKLIGTVGYKNFIGMTLPPFVPNRVLSQKYYIKEIEEPVRYKISTANEIHKNQTSVQNMERLIRNVSKDGIFIWYNSGSENSRHGSLMVYSVKPEIKVGWHILFTKKDNWRIGKTSYISKKEIELLISSKNQKPKIATNKIL